MIEAREFIEAGRALGFGFYAGVPCSFLTPFINYVIDDPGLDYVSSANEGDALATASGAALAGRRAVVMMQNSGLGNAVSPLTSLNWVFRIPVLLICTHRGAPGVKDEPQHALMGQITGALLDTMQVPWETFPTEAADIGPALERAGAYMAREHRPYALIMQKGTVAPHALGTTGPPGAGPRRRTAGIRLVAPAGSALPSRGEVLSRLIEATPSGESVVVATTGYTGRELYALADRPNQLYMVGSMGCASSLGLGLALARRDLRVVVVDGDGAALMRMGNLATVGAYGQDNLVHLLLDNGVHDSTGAQATVSASVDFAAVARACGYGRVLSGDTMEVLDAALARGPGEGPTLAHLKIRAGTLDGLPRPAMTPPEVRARLMDTLGSVFP